jgi:hypothetical protein
MSRAMYTRSFLWLVVANTLLCLTGRGAFAESCDAPNPDFTISAPPASVGPVAAAFSGVWAGTWLLEGVGAGNRILQCARIHVSIKDSDNAKVVYCYGSRTDVGTKPQCDRYPNAVIRGKYLIFVTSDGANISLQLQRPGIAQATGALPSATTSIVTDFHKL